MQAVLLTGGLGTRLRSVINDRPKPLAPVAGRPFLEYVVRELAASGIRELVFAVGYRGEMIQEAFGDGSRLGVRISYAFEETLLGTGGAVRNAAPFLTDPYFFVLNGDTFYRMDYGALLRLRGERELDLALVLRRVEDISRYGEAVLEDGRLARFNEKTGERRPGTINGGVYLMSRALLDEIPPGKVSLEQDLIPAWMREGRRLGGMVSDGYFIDIGVPEDYFRFQEDVEKGAVRW